MSRADENILVISDLHLGADLIPSATDANRLHVDMVERQLVQFLRYYTRRREDGRSWRLVINGDFIDFLAICITKTNRNFEALVGPSATLDEQSFGLHRSCEGTLCKLEAVITRHSEVFRALHKFVAQGHKLDIVCGNHDVELGWPAVQEVFRNAVKTAHKARTEHGEEFWQQAVQFHPWFFHVPDVLWVEHGHQYDECCSFENQLCPTESDGKHIVMNVDTAGARYITNAVSETAPHEQDAWSALGYLRLGFGLGARGCVRLARSYHLFAVRLLSVWWRHRQIPNIEAKRQHEERLVALADKTNISKELLEQVDGLRRRPAVDQLGRLAPIVMIDKVFAFGFALLLTVLGFSLFGRLGAWVMAAASLGLAHGLSTWTSRKRSTDPGPELAAAGEGVARAANVRYVVFGHTHEPVARPSEGSVYFNLGTWLPHGRPGILRAFTHLIVRRRENDVNAELRQWRDGLSRPFTPGWMPAEVRRKREHTSVTQTVTQMAPKVADALSSKAEPIAEEARSNAH